MKKNVKEEINIKPINLTKKEIKELQNQFPVIGEIIEGNKKERLKNKIEIIVITFGIAIILLFLYVTYLMITYQWQ